MNSEDQSKGRPLLSIIVIGRNEGERLSACLQSVNAMQRGNWELELLYIDSGSSDGSVNLAAALGARTIALSPQSPTAALARNAGWQAARGEIVLFLDGDTVLAPAFVSGTLPVFEDSKIAVAWGHRRESHPQTSIYNRVLDLDWIYAAGPSEFCGGDALVRRDVLVATGGFDPALIAGEEPELCRRMMAAGHRIEHVDRMMTKHDLAMTTFGQYWRRAIRAGHAFAEVSSRFANSQTPFWDVECRRNRTRALTIAALPITAIFLAAVLVSIWPLVAAAAFLGALALRSAWKARWKTKSIVTLLLYGVHVHLQQLPIYLGQMQFRRNQRRGAKAQLMEYKQP